MIRRLSAFDRRSYQFVISIITILSFISVFSQEKLTTEELAQMSLEELMNVSISTASKHEQKIRETPASVYVFTRQDIKQNGYRYLSDILRFIPNMGVHWSGGPQYTVTANLRGMAEFILLIDGIRIDPASSVKPHFGYVYPLNHVEKIEVIMGPSSVLYGADACAGIINIITLNPVEKESINKVEFFTGNHNLIGTQALLQQPLNSINFQLSLSGFHFNDKDKKWWSYLEDAYAEYPTHISKHYQATYENPFNSFVASGKVNTGNTTLGFNFWTRDVKGGLRLDPARYTANKHTKTSSHEYLLYIQNRFTINDRMTLLSRLSHNYYQVKYNFYYTKKTLDDAKFYRESADRIHWLEEFDYRISANHRLLFGIEAQSIVNVPKAYKINTDSTGKEIGFGTPISNNDALTYYQIRSGGVFLQVENSFFDGQLKTNIGARSDFYSTFANTINPRASIYYQVANPLSIRIIYGSAFFTAPADKMYRTSYVPGKRFQITNKDLQPRTNSNYEFAVDYQPVSWLFAEARAFRNEVKDEIVFINTKNPYIVNRDTVNIYQHQNVGKARYQGFEGTIRLILPHKFRAQTSISYLDGFTQADNNSQKKDLNLYTGLRVAWNLNRIFFNKANFNVQGLHLLNRTAKEGNVLYPDGNMADVFLLNLFLSADNLWKGIGCNLKIDNLLNTKWSDIPGPSSSASPEFPQEQMRLLFGLHWQF